MKILVRRRVSLAGSPPTVSASSPSIGDKYGGALLTLTVTGTVTGVLVDGTPCTNVVQTSPTTVTCRAPSKDPGIYDIAVSGPLGSSTPLPAAYESWHPTVAYSAARAYQSDQAVTSSGSATRQRMGVHCTDMGIMAPDPVTPAPVDGQGFVELASGRWLLAGGAPNGHSGNVTNTIWKSDDRGKTWQVLLASAPASSTRPAKAHTFGFFTMTISGTEYVYWLGSDPFTPSGDVFRSSDGGSTWTRICTTCPTSGLALFNYGVLNGVIYVMGGQLGMLDTDVVSNMVYKSTDGGVTWTTVGAAPWVGRGAQMGPMPVKDGKLWLVAGARYHSTDATSWYNDVWSYDGTTWTQVLANGHGQFAKRRYHNVVAFNGRLWLFNGSTSDGATITPETKGTYYSADGATWTAWADETPWNACHAGAAIVSSDGIYLTDGYQSTRLHVVREHTGALVSQWNDLGSGAKHLLQATDAQKPILDLTAFPSRPGIVGTQGQVMTLASPDRGITNGIYEAYVVFKTLNFDTSNEQAPNAPSNIVGSVNGSAWNNFGTNGGTVEYDTASGGWSESIAGSGVNNDNVHVIGVQHTSESGGTVRLYIDSVLVGTTTSKGFDTSWTGWDSILAGYLGADKAECVLGAVVVLRGHSTPSNNDFRSRLQTWAQIWAA
jgi:hypothetical protein